MRILLLIVAMFFTNHSSLAAADSHIAHDFHYSRMELEWNESTQTWQGILRIFTDDLERAMSQRLNAPIAWKLGDAKEHPLSDEHIQNYVVGHWNIFGASGQLYEWDFIGKEVDFDLTYVYIESAPMNAMELDSVASDGLFELFEDQVNEFSFKAPGNPSRLWITKEEPRQSLKRSQHD